MAITVIQDMPGAGAEVYDAVSSALNFDQEPTAGLVFHVAGPVDGGWRLIAVWDSREAYDAFVRLPVTRHRAGGG